MDLVTLWARGGVRCVLVQKATGEPVWLEILEKGYLLRRQSNGTVEEALLRAVEWEREYLTKLVMRH